MPTLQRRVEGWSGCLGSRALLSIHAGSVFGEARLPGRTSSGDNPRPPAPRWDLPPVLPGRLLSGWALDRHQQEGEQAELAGWRVGIGGAL